MPSAIEELQGAFRVDTPINEINRKALDDLLSLEGEKLDLLRQTYAMIENSIWKIVQRNKKCRSVETHCHKARPLLSEFRAYKFPKILKDMKINPTSSMANPFIWQLLIEKVYLKLLLNMHQGQDESTTEHRQLGKIELNAIRYAAGFVVHKAMQTKFTVYRHRPHPKKFYLKKIQSSEFMF